MLDKRVAAVAANTWVSGDVERQNLCHHPTACVAQSRLRSKRNPIPRRARLDLAWFMLRLGESACVAREAGVTAIRLLVCRPRPADHYTYARYTTAITPATITHTTTNHHTHLQRHVHDICIH